MDKIEEPTKTEAEQLTESDIFMAMPPMTWDGLLITPRRSCVTVGTWLDVAVRLAVRRSDVDYSALTSPCIESSMELLLSCKTDAPIAHFLYQKGSSKGIISCADIMV